MKTHLTYIFVLFVSSSNFLCAQEFLPEKLRSARSDTNKLERNELPIVDDNVAKAKIYTRLYFTGVDSSAKAIPIDEISRYENLMDGVDVRGFWQQVNPNKTDDFKFPLKDLAGKKPIASRDFENWIRLVYLAYKNHKQEEPLNAEVAAPSRAYQISHRWMSLRLGQKNAPAGLPFSIQQIPSETITGVLDELTRLESGALSIAVDNHPIAEALFYECTREYFERVLLDQNGFVNASDQITPKNIEAAIKRCELKFVDFDLVNRIRKQFARIKQYRFELDNQEKKADFQSLHRIAFNLSLCIKLAQCNNTKVTGSSYAADFFDSLSLSESDEETDILTSDWNRLHERIGSDKRARSLAARHSRVVLLNQAITKQLNGHDDKISERLIELELNCYFDQLLRDVPLSYACQLKNKTDWSSKGLLSLLSKEFVGDFEISMPCAAVSISKKLHKEEQALFENSIKYLCKEPAGEHIKARAFAYLCALLLEKNEHTKELTNQNALFLLLGDFINKYPEYKSPLLQQSSWCKFFWNLDTWKDDGPMSKIGLSDKELEYHRQHVATLAFFSQELGGTFALVNSEKPLHTSESQQGTVLAIDSNSPLSRVKKFVDTHIEEKDESKIWEIYRSLLLAIYDGQILYISDEFIDDETLNSIINRGDNIPQADLDLRKEIKDRRFIPFNDVWFPQTGPRTSIDQTLKEINNLFTADQKNSRAKTLYNFICENKYKKLKQTGIELPTHDGQHFYEPLSFEQLDKLFQKIGNTPELELSNKGKGVYDRAITQLLWAAVARIKQEQASRTHMSCGFIYDVDRESAFVEKSNSIDRLGTFRKARKESIEALMAYAHSFKSSAIRTQVLEGAQPFDIFGARYFASGFSTDESSTANDAADIGLNYELNIGLQRIQQSFRNTPLNHVKRTINVDGKEISVPAMCFCAVVGFSETDANLKRIDAGLDAFGFSGFVQMVDGLPSYFQRLNEIANQIEHGAIENPADFVKNDLSVQIARLAVEAADQRVRAHGARLARAQFELQRAQIANEVMGFEVTVQNTIQIKEHFGTEAARLLAKANQMRADACLLNYNKAKYEAFCKTAQIEMMLVSLPSYNLELEASRMMINRVLNAENGEVKQIINMLIAERKAFLDSQKKDVLSIVRKVAVTLVDAVCMCYGLPPIGSIVDSIADGVVAIDEGRWDEAFSSFSNAAKLSGLDKKVDKLFKDELKNLSDEFKWIEKFSKSDFFKDIEKLAKQTGLGDLAKAAAVSYTKSWSKNHLPEDLVEFVLPNANEQKQMEKLAIEGADDKKTPDEPKQIFKMMIASKGEQLVKTLASSGANQVMSGIKGERLKKILTTRLGIPEEKISVEEQLKSLEQEIRKEAFDNIKKAVSNQANKVPELNQKIREIADREIEYKLGGLLDKPGEQVSEELNNLIENTQQKIQDGNEIRRQLEQKDILPAKKADLEKRLETQQNQLKHELSKFGENELNKLGQELFKSIDAKKLLDGDSPITEDCLKQVFTNYINGHLAHIETKYDPNISPETLRKDLDDIKSSLKESVATIETAVDIAVVKVIAMKFQFETVGAEARVLEAWSQELNAMLLKLKKENGGKLVSEDIEEYWNFVKEDFNQADLFKDKPELQQQWKALKNAAPKVTLDPEIMKAFAGFDEAMQAADDSVRGLLFSESKIRDHIHDIAKSEKFEEARKELEKTLRQPLEAALTKTELALEAAGSPTMGFRSFFESNKIENKSSLNNYVNAKLALIRAQKEAINEQRELSEDEKTRLKQDVKDKRRAYYEDFDANGKFGFVGDLSSMLGENELLPEGDEPSVDVQFQSRQKEPNGALKANETDEKMKAVYKRSAENVKQLLSKMGEDETNPTGLYGNVYNRYHNSYSLEIKQLVEKFDQEAAQYDALSYAANASAMRASMNAQKIRVDQARLNQKITKLAIKVCKATIEEEKHLLKAAEFEYRKASSELALVSCQQWRYQQSGRNKQFYTPQDIEELNRLTWRTFRDLIFVAKYYDGDNKLESDFLSDLKKVMGENGLREGKRWRPDWIRSMAKRMLNRYKNQWLNREKDVVKCEAKIVVSASQLLDAPRNEERNEIVLYCEVKPFDGNVTFENPKSTILGNRYVPTVVNDEHDVASIKKHSRKVFTFDISRRGRPVIRNIESFYLDFKPIDNKANKINIRHLGDGFLVVPFTSKVQRKALPIRWKPSKFVEVDPYKTEAEGFIESKWVQDKIKETLRNEDYFVKDFNVYYQNRPNFYLYPMAGTYELTFPGNLVDCKEKDGEINWTHGKDGKEWKCVIYLIGTSSSR